MGVPMEQSVKDADDYSLKASLFHMCTVRVIEQIGNASPSWAAYFKRRGEKSHAM
jgi:hypothetical protein